MIFRCKLKSCPHFSSPCEFETVYDYKCPVGEAGPLDFEEIYEPENEFFCLIVGSRDFSNYELFRNKMDLLLSNVQDYRIIIVSGGAKGTDSLAERYAEEKCYKCYVINADWGIGKNAGYLRNEEMHMFISKHEHRGCVAFWNGTSKGTAHSFELAKKYGNPIRLVKV